MTRPKTWFTSGDEGLIQLRPYVQATARQQPDIDQARPPRFAVADEGMVKACIGTWEPGPTALPSPWKRGP